MTHETLVQKLFGDLEEQDSTPPPLDDMELVEQDYQELLQAVSACDDLGREIELDPTAGDPIPELDRKVA